MPVYLFTFHAYLSWLPDRPQGYVEKGEDVLPQDFDRAREYREIAAHEPIAFDSKLGWTLIEESRSLCLAEAWELYEATADRTHTHVLVGWRDNSDWRRVATRFKQRLGAALSKAANRPGPWFSRGGSRKRVRDRKHFDYLRKTYLPKHGPIRYSLWKEKP